MVADTLQIRHNMIQITGMGRFFLRNSKLVCTNQCCHDFFIQKVHCFLISLELLFGNRHISKIGFCRSLHIFTNQRMHSADFLVNLSNQNRTGLITGFINIMKCCFLFVILTANDKFRNFNQIFRTWQKNRYCHKVENRIGIGNLSGRISRSCI